MGILIKAKIDAYQKGVLPDIPLPTLKDSGKCLFVGDDGNYILRDPENPTNLITQVCINSNPLPIQDGSVNIKIASTNDLGVVLSSTNDNCILIKENGQMEVNNLNTNKLVQTELFILNANN